MQRLVTRAVAAWLPLAVVTTILAGTIYGVVQQAFRQGADLPQLQMAEDAAHAVAGGTPALSLPQVAGTDDVGHSLAPFLMIYNANGHLAISSGELDGQPPVLPDGVLDSIARLGVDRFTWQPAPGVRLAAVGVKVKGGPGGYILAARSLREVERQIDQTTVITGIGWLLAMIGGLLGCLLVSAVATAIGMGPNGRYNPAS